MIIGDQRYISFLSKRILQYLHLKILDYPIICLKYKFWKRKVYITAISGYNFKNNGNKIELY